MVATPAEGGNSYTILILYQVMVPVMILYNYIYRTSTVVELSLVTS